jgi:hypothetical protein
MKFLTRNASSAFLSTSKSAHLMGLISWSQLMDRLVVLRDMCRPNDPSGHLAQRLLRLEEWTSESNWPYEGDSPSNLSQGPNSPSSLGSSLDYRPDEDDVDSYLCFFPGTSTGLSAWKFHQYDDDFFPSVPHGHCNGRSKPKLDPYQGWVYHGSEQVRREPKKNIVALWNDPQFREFAKIAIDYYLTHHSAFRGWRVPNPRHLPRRRG